MARTINRVPTTVPTPSDDNVKSYYFNHYNWKGINENDNFLAVDQESFEDTCNVYPSERGLLKSRPCTRVSEYFGKDYTTTEYWKNFEHWYTRVNDYEIIVYSQPVAQGLWKSTLLIGDGTDYRTVELNYALRHRQVFFIKDNKLITIGSNDWTSFYVYWEDGSPKVEYDLTKILYVPITQIDGTIGESKNYLLNGERKVYNYNPVIGLPVEAYGKTLVYKDEEYETSFVLNQIGDEKRILNRVATLPAGATNIAISSKNTYAYMLNGQFVYSLDGKTIDFAKDIDGTVSKIKFSDTGDGAMVTVTLADEKFIYVILVTDGLTQPKGYQFILGSSPIGIVADAYSLDPRWGKYLVAYRDGDNCYVTAWWNGDGVYNNKLITGSPPGPIVLNDIVGNYDYKAFIILENNYANLWRWTNEDLQVEQHTIKNGFIRRSTILDTNTVYFYWFSQQTNPHDYLFTELKTNGATIDTNLYNRTVYQPVDLNNRYLISSADAQFQIGAYQHESIGSIEQDIFVTYNETEFLNNLVGINDDAIYFSHVNDDNTINIYSNYFTDVMTLTYTSPLTVNYLNFDLTTDNEETFFSKDKNVYITKYIEEDDEYKLYVPHLQEYDFQVTGLHRLSTTETAVFTANKIYVLSLSDGNYYNHQSKLDVGIKFGASVITSYDGTQLIFPTERGLAVMSYQDFVATTEQQLGFVTDPIITSYKNYYNESESIHLDKYLFYIIMWNKVSNEVWVFDIRTSSWWRQKLPFALQEVLLEKRLMGDAIYELLTTDREYHDELANGMMQNIDWYFRSQKLYLNAVNYYKHIENITLSCVEESPDTVATDSFVENPRGDRVYVELTTKNYRKYVNSNLPENFHYDVEVIRTFVKRLNYAKVCEFQYQLANSDIEVYRTPLNISNVTIKYKIGGQVR